MASDPHPLGHPGVMLPHHVTRIILRMTMLFFFTRQIFATVSSTPFAGQDQVAPSSSAFRESCIRAWPEGSFQDPAILIPSSPKEGDLEYCHLSGCLLERKFLVVNVHLSCDFKSASQIRTAPVMVINKCEGNHGHETTWGNYSSQSPKPDKEIHHCSKHIRKCPQKGSHF